MRVLSQIPFHDYLGRISFSTAEDLTRGSATMVSFKGAHEEPIPIGQIVDT